ncbi:MAG: hypothetical protein BIFFINMI_03735 [Phycisphaerae bacterium]|nr:hypothetical protein [Phycisphaerae bacterium]
MRILLTSPFPLWPINFGAAVRTTSLAAFLAERHEVTLLSADVAGPPEALDDRPFRWLAYPGRGRAGHFFNRAFARALAEQLDPPPDLVVASYPFQSRMIAPAVRRAGVPLVYDAHNIECDRFRTMASPPVRWLVARSEWRMCRAARAVLVIGQRDADLLARHYGREGIRLANGVDTRRFTPGPPDAALRERLGLAGKPVALYFGTYHYPPNVQSLRLLADWWPGVLARCPDARLLVVGVDPPAWAATTPGFVVAGWVPDILPYIRLANMVVAPLLSGGGTRLKLVEALACGQRALCTPFAAIGLPAESDALDLTSIEEFPARLADLLADPPTPGANAGGRQLAEQFDWSRLIAAVDWESLAEK